MNQEELCYCRMIHPERIQRAKGSVLDAGQIEDLAQLFKAMADSNRLKLLLALSEEEMCVCDLAAFLGVTESAISHQLRSLRILRLVANRRQGTTLYYRLADEHVARLIRLGLEHVRE